MVTKKHLGEVIFASAFGIIVLWAMVMILTGLNIFQYLICTNNITKKVVFDLDETLGSFVEFGMFEIR